MRKTNWMISSIVLAVSVAGTAPLAAAQQAVPSASALLRFYPARLASTPTGMVEDRDVWLAKVQGLMAGAPPMLQQSLLQSQTAWEFAANVALLQQMQEGSLKQNAARIQRQFQNEGVPRKAPIAPSTTGSTPQQ
jgi:hypothetical protein